MARIKFKLNFLLSFLLTSGSLLISSSSFADVECKAGPAMLPLVQVSTSVPILCLDSVTAKDGSSRSIFLSSANQAAGSAGDKFSFVILDVAANGKPTSQIRIGDSSLFPRGCGMYFMGARVLPGSQKLAALYPAAVVRLIDFTDPNHLDIQIGIPTPFHVDAYTCEGYFPNWNAGRESYDPENGVKIDGTNRLVIETYTAQDPVDQVDPLTLTPTQKAFYARAYDEECTGSNSDSRSQKCQDLKQAVDQGIFLIRSKVYPKQTVMVGY